METASMREPDKYRERARGTPALEAVLISGERRFRPVLLTTITTVAGLLPMALGLWGESLVFGPFAAAIVAGLSVSSLLTLFVVPSLYISLETFKDRFRKTAPEPGPPPLARPESGFPLD